MKITALIQEEVRVTRSGNVTLEMDLSEAVKLVELVNKVITNDLENSHNEATASPSQLGIADFHALVNLRKALEDAVKAK